jgi:cytochrome c oxidase subunit 2
VSILPAAQALVDTRREYGHLFSIYVPIAIGVFALIATVTLVASLVFSRRQPEQAARWYEHNVLEGGYATLLTLIVAFLLYLTFPAEHRVDTVANRQRPALTLDVTASKWEWQFTYRDYGFSVRSGTVGRQPLVVPVDEPVRFNLNSLDVIHAMWVPHLRFKHDVIPGSTQVSTLTFGQRGVFDGECAEFCGLRHSDMLFTVHVVDPGAFRAWAAAGGEGRAP